MKEDGSCYSDVEKIMCLVIKYNMNLNPSKCSYEVNARKFWRFILSYIGIQVNSHKFQDVINMKSKISIKEVQQLM